MIGMHMIMFENDIQCLAVMSLKSLTDIRDKYFWNDERGCCCHLDSVYTAFEEAYFHQTTFEEVYFHQIMLLFCEVMLVPLMCFFEVSDSHVAILYSIIISSVIQLVCLDLQLYRYNCNELLTVDTNADKKFSKTIYRNIDINYDKLSNKNIDKSYNANFDENVDKFDNGFSKIPYANHSKFKISISSYFESVNCSILNWDKGINKTLDKNFDKNFNRMLVDLIKIFLFCNIPYIDVPNLNSVDENYNMNLNYNKKLKMHNWNFHPKSYKVFNNFKIYLVNHIRTALPGCDNYIYLMKPSLAYYFDIIDTYIIMNLLNLNKIIYNKGFKWSKNAHPWYDRFTFILAHTGHDSCTYFSNNTA